MELKSKPLLKINDPGQLLTSLAIPGGGAGIDLDFLIFGSYGFILFEFLRCVTVPARESHPRRYWHKNWRKFLTLWNLQNKLRARLFLINFEFDDQTKQFHAIKIMRCLHEPKPTENKTFVTEDILEAGLFEFQSWFSLLNQETVNENATHCLYCKRILSIDHNKCPYCTANFCSFHAGTACDHCQLID